MKELGLAELIEVADFPVDLRAPRVNSSRWKVLEGLFYLSLPAVTGVAAGVLGYQISLGLHMLHKV
jgi:hypothetical protein